MGLFRRGAEPAATIDLNETDAVAGVALAAMYADGVLGAEEHELLVQHLTQLPLFAQQGERDLRDMFVRLEALAASEGEAELLARCAAAVPARLRGTAFLVAVDILLGDAEVAADELGFLGRVQRALHVDDVLAKKITDVVALKHVR